MALSLSLSLFFSLERNLSLSPSFSSEFEFFFCLPALPISSELRRFPIFRFLCLPPVFGGIGTFVSDSASKMGNMNSPMHNPRNTRHNNTISILCAFLSLFLLCSLCVYCVYVPHCSLVLFLYFFILHSWYRCLVRFYIHFILCVYFSLDFRPHIEKSWMSTKWPHWENKMDEEKKRATRNVCSYHGIFEENSRATLFRYPLKIDCQFNIPK